MKNANITSPTAARIFSAWEKEGRAETPRRYLGASIVGHECDMYLWLNFRGIVREIFDGRMYRLFDRGKREESVFCNDLRRIGCEVREFDENGSQFAITDLGGHFSGHLDGIVRGLPEAPTEWHVVEFKTHSDASFKKLCKEGVAKAKPMHYAQMTAYMGHTGLKRALYMAVNKDNDDLWVERIEFDQKAYDAIMARAKHIVDTVQPDRCASRRDDYRCKACPHASVCWHDAPQFVDPTIHLSCRACCHATADTEHDGACWSCRLGHSCTSDGMCDDFLILPTLVKGEVCEGDERGILYSYETTDGNTDGITIGKRGFSVEEAMKFGPAEAREVKAVKDRIPGSSVVADNSISVKFKGDGHQIYFRGDRDGLMAWNGSFDMTNPIRREEHDGEKWFEYSDEWCICVKGTEFIVYGETPPF